MRTLLRLAAACLVVPGALALAQDKPADSPATGAPQNTFSTSNKMSYGRLKDILLRSAEKMPEENYSFKPADSVRTYGQIVGHVADAQYLFCSAALGEKNPGLDIEKTKTSKADIIAALKTAFAYCDNAYNTMTDASGAATVKFFNGDMPKSTVLMINNLHNIEHYGNLVVYLRMKNIVPPTSEPNPQQAQPAAQKK